ncbi:NAD-dependent succinate-semialdehyde dehydrogenase [Glycomyces tenuis]|nr:NAD-dependent succinate-semialdehyde dehydrogenase [Glycomyces tenuis]
MNDLPTIIHDLSPDGPGSIVIEDPATSRTVGRVPDSSLEGWNEALAAASAAGPAWSARSSRERSDILHECVRVLLENRDDLARTITLEMGKPVAESQAEVDYAVDYIRWYAEEAVRPAGDYRADPKGGSAIITTRAPVGLALLIAPWNFPMAMATRKIAPALAAGCTAVVKPAELTPLTTYLVVRLMIRAGVPEDAVRVVTTTDPAAMSASMMADPRVRKVSFTGSTGVGAVLLGQAAPRIMRTSMELGGNAPLIVFDDADLERAVDGAFAAKMRNGGQSCVAANRILVQDGIADAFVDGLAERFDGMVLGHGLEEGTTLGPVIDARAVRRIGELVEDALDRGAVEVTAERDLPDEGHFVAPSLLDRVDTDARISSTEIFGPVAAVSRFSDPEQALAIANDTPHGLAAYVFTESLERAFDTAERLETGMVGINRGVISNVAAPFGGVKTSGIGREGSSEGIEEYQEIRYLNLDRRR